MASKLDRMFQPGERVVFRAGVRHKGFRAWFWYGFPTAVIGLACLGFLIEGAGALSFLGSVIFVMTASQASGAAVLTDKRLLYEGGVLRLRIFDIPLSRIDRITRVGSGVTLRNTHDKRHCMRGVPNDINLARAIIAQTGVPGPGFLKTPARGRGAAGVRLRDAGESF